jgi:hypothetical protein
MFPAIGFVISAKLANSRIDTQFKQSVPHSIGILRRHFIRNREF